MIYILALVPGKVVDTLLPTTTAAGISISYTRPCDPGKTLHLSRPFQTYYTKKGAIGTMSSLAKSLHEDYHWGEVRHDSGVPQC